MNKNKKIILAILSSVAVATPAIAVVSCGTKKQTSNPVNVSMNQNKVDTYKINGWDQGTWWANSKEEVLKSIMASSNVEKSLGSVMQSENMFEYDKMGFAYGERFNGNSSHETFTIFNSNKEAMKFATENTRNNRTGAFQFSISVDNAHGNRHTQNHWDMNDLWSIESTHISDWMSKDYESTPTDAQLSDGVMKDISVEMHQIGLVPEKPQTGGLASILYGGQFGISVDQGQLEADRVKADDIVDKHYETITPFKNIDVVNFYVGALGADFEFNQLSDDISVYPKLIKENDKFIIRGQQKMSIYKNDILSSVAKIKINESNDNEIIIDPLDAELRGKLDAAVQKPWPIDLAPVDENRFVRTIQPEVGKLIVKINSGKVYEFPVKANQKVDPSYFSIHKSWIVNGESELKVMEANILYRNTTVASAIYRTATPNNDEVLSHVRVNISKTPEQRPYYPSSYEIVPVPIFNNEVGKMMSSDSEEWRAIFARKEEIKRQHLFKLVVGSQTSPTFNSQSELEKWILQTLVKTS